MRDTRNIPLFQFQKGSINTMTIVAMAVIVANFNSKKVRLIQVLALV